MHVATSVQIGMLQLDQGAHCCRWPSLLPAGVAARAPRRLLDLRGALHPPCVLPLVGLLPEWHTRDISGVKS